MMWRLLKKIILLLLLLPYGLTLIYWIIPPISTLMLAQWAQLKPAHRDWEPLENISPNLQRAVVAAEDDAFCTHWGLDLKQLEKSVNTAVTSDKRPRGASTITQQTAKNLYLWNGRSWLRKALEVPLALWLEIVWPKRRILEVYLNIAEWGKGIYGAEAASQYYFGVSARQLSSHQAALLAVMLPDPRHRSASRPGPGVILMSGQLERRVGASNPDLSCIRK